MSTTVIVNFNTKPELLSDFEKTMEQVKQDLPTVEGCERADIFQSLQEKTHFVVVEQWASEEAHQQHLSELKRQGVWDALLEQLETEPEGIYHEQL